MSTKTIGCVVGMIVIATAGGVAWRAGQSTQAAQAACAVIARERANLEVAISRAEDRDAKESSRRTELRATLNGLETPTAAGSVPVRPPRAFPLDTAGVIATDPRLQVLALAARRAALPVVYGPLFRTLALSPEQTAKFIDVAVKRAELNQDLVKSSRSMDSADRKAAWTLQQQGQAAFEVAQAELLGAAGFRQLQDYERTLFLRNLVERYSGSTLLAGVPLTFEQVEGMTRLIAAAHPNYQSGGSLLYREIDWSAVDVHAGEILSAEQLELFQRTEPPGNGPSRFKSRLGKLIGQALQSDTWGNRPPPPALRPGAREMPRS